MTRTWTSTSRVAAERALLVACLVAVLALTGCGASKEAPAEQPETRKAPPAATRTAAPEPKPARFVPEPVRITEAGEVDFDINWPPRSLTPRKPSRRSLLTGQWKIWGDRSQKDDPNISIKLTLRRPHVTNADRKYWNAMTEFKQYKHWMPYVRGRDADGKEWLWPNLAYLFKLHGTDRVERYGGWDPGHHADNDFGAVLIRKLTPWRRDELDRPLVSADWYTSYCSRRLDVEHTTESDIFTLHPDDPSKPFCGRARLWFVYGDFMDWLPPWKYASGPMKNRPLRKEYAGGIIAQFRIAWRRCAPNRPFKFTVTQETPSDNTGFDWKKWIARKTEWDTPEAEPRLTDRPKRVPEPSGPGQDRPGPAASVSG